MPKNNKKKNKLNNIEDGVDHNSEISFDGKDEGSVISEISEFSEKSNLNEIDIVDKQSLLLQTISECCDKLSESNTSIRSNSLKYLFTTFQLNVFNIDETWNYNDTLLDGLERIIRKGKFDEQCLAIKVLTNFIIQVGNEFINKCCCKLKEIFEPLYRQPSYTFGVRQAALNAICITYLMASDINYRDVLISMEYIEIIFRGSYLKGDGCHPNITTEMIQLHTTALDCWGVLFTLIPSSIILDLVSPLLPKFYQLLKSVNVDLRISAGSLLALIYERIRHEINNRFKGNDYPFFIAELELLAKDGSKFRAKVERKKQRQSFRDILTAIQTETVEFPIYNVQFGNETLELLTWSEKSRYDILCDVIGTGVNKHLQNNIFIREIFDLGLPINVDKLELKQSKLSHKERNLANQANSKVRKQARQSNRTKRMNINDIHLSD